MKCSFEIKKEDFVPEHTLTCGQFFRYQKEEDGSYLVTSQDKRAKLVDKGEAVEVVTEDDGYFRHFFDCGADYGAYKKSLLKYSYLKEPIAHGSGIRLLKQSTFETIVSFIISQNNNIPRIQKIIESLCKKVGTKRKDCFGEFYAFPSQQQMLKLTETEYRELGLGYRAKYLEKVVPLLSSQFCEGLESLSTKEARARLVALPGVGRKVADCVLLFSLSRGDVFPVDVWVERVFFSYFEVEAIRYPVLKKSREKMSDFFVSKFGGLSGLVQQYLFYFMRQSKQDKGATKKE